MHLKACASQGQCLAQYGVLHAVARMYFAGDERYIRLLVPCATVAMRWLLDQLFYPKKTAVAANSASTAPV